MMRDLVDRMTRAYAVVAEALETRREGRPYWEGELSTSALSTAVAVSAMALALRETQAGRILPEATAGLRLHTRIYAGLAWLADHQNTDGGWGDTTESRSNVSTSLLALSAIMLAASATDIPDDMLATTARGEAYLNRHGGTGAIAARYGDDRTFSAPILMNAALAGLAEWRAVAVLPFELAVLPQRLFRWLGLPVVSYALPALIAVGLARFHEIGGRHTGFVARRRGHAFYAVPRFLRRLAVRPALRRLKRLIPPSGGFLEATPITGFVVMALLAAGRGAHPAATRGLAFLAAAHRTEPAPGGWPIDINLSVWNTTLAVNALGTGDAATRDWLLAQQGRRRHVYTGAAPGGWGWSHLPGSVPDADDTAGALLALSVLPDPEASAPAARAGVRWLVNLQNRDGGWPTFCRGWGKLPFDRSAPDLTAHALRALAAWRPYLGPRLGRRTDRALARGLRHLARAQHEDGRWVPLWFGNQNAPREENPTIGTARVLLAYRDLGRLDDPCARRGRAWLLAAQNQDGSWGGDAGVPGTIEETALACEALLGNRGTRPTTTLTYGPAISAGLTWLSEQILQGGMDEPSPIGLYFARLWYFERQYPVVFAASALTAALMGREGRDMCH